jgi:hypothetical protein
VAPRFVQLGPVRPLDGERSALPISAVREGLLNAEKHANARTVIVSLGEAGGDVQGANHGDLAFLGDPLAGLPWSTALVMDRTVDWLRRHLSP